ncbi:MULTISPECIES: FixH family protein [Bacillus]|uniref:FixH family protein n=1 Tax=Bacillus TaxID=1386 RepID=UPI0003F6A8DB|nr:MULTISPECIES: FixH family protein [Bacillus]QHZ48171.1 FixH family protein [Bacillus sp. NSP9.1]WFA04245.1 FixH family protein [Bacillus sp. HSf4]
MRWGKWIVLLFLAIGLTACGQTEKPAASDENPKVLTAKLSAPEQVAKNEKAVIKATVLYGDEPVADADEVEFESWKAGSKEESQLQKAKHEGKGVYSIEKSFPDDGHYKIQVHVTAKNQHTMPVADMTVGSPGDEHQGDDEKEETHHH